jgi:PAS domain S-box-containing protein
VADGLDAVVGSAERTARLVARELGDRGINAAAAEKRARDVLLEGPNFLSCILTLDASAAAGRPAPLAVEVHRVESASRFAARDLTAAAAGASPAGAAERATPWPHSWYEEVREKGQPVWSEPFFDREASRNAVRVAAPVFRNPDDREVVGAVAIVLDLEWLRRLANLQEFSDTSFTIVFSRTGRIVLHPRPTYAIAETIETLAEKTGAPDLLTIRRNILSRRQGILEYAETTPARRVHVNYKPAKSAGWGIIVGFDEAEFLKAQRAYRAITFGLLGALLLLLAAIVVIVTHLALRPLAQLSVAADEIARRNLDCAIPIPRRVDEIGRLARSFLAMRDALKAEHLERRWAAQSLEHQLNYHRLIIDSMHELVFVLTKTLRISRVNPATIRGLGHDEAQIVQAPLARFVRIEGRNDAATSEFLIVALREERELNSVPAVVLPRDGRERPARLNLVLIRDVGRVVGGVVTLRFLPGAAPSDAQGTASSNLSA